MSNVESLCVVARVNTEVLAGKIREAVNESITADAK
jgi:hypothetical protein